MWSAFGQMYAKGGVWMHPLLVCALLGLALIVERLWTLWRARIDTRNLMMEVMRALRQEGPRAAMRVCESARGPIANMLHAGLMRAHHGPEAVEKAIHTAGSIEMAFLERGLLAPGGPGASGGRDRRFGVVRAEVGDGRQRLPLRNRLRPARCRLIRATPLLLQIGKGSGRLWPRVVAHP